MERELILRMAREAGMVLIGKSWFTGNLPSLANEQLERFAALVAAHERERAWTEKDWDEAAEWIRQQEREACAKVCDKEVEEWGYDADVFDVSIAIRARGEK